MRVLLYRLKPGEELAPGVIAGLVGKPVLDKPGNGRRVGRIVRAELVGGDVYANLELDQALLPHELFTPPVSIIHGLKQ